MLYISLLHATSLLISTARLTALLILSGIKKEVEEEEEQKRCLRPPENRLIFVESPVATRGRSSIL